jgi:hypothetical protein
VLQPNVPQAQNPGQIRITVIERCRALWRVAAVLIYLEKTVARASYRPTAHSEALTRAKPHRRVEDQRPAGQINFDPTRDGLK